MFTGSKFFSFSLHGALHFLLKPWEHHSCCWVLGVSSIPVFQQSGPYLLHCVHSMDLRGFFLEVLCLILCLIPASPATALQISFKSCTGAWMHPGAAWVLLFQSRRGALSISRVMRLCHAQSLPFGGFPGSCRAVLGLALSHVCVFSPQTGWNMALPCKRARNCSATSPPVMLGMAP